MKVDIYLYRFSLLNLKHYFLLYMNLSTSQPLNNAGLDYKLISGERVNREKKPADKLRFSNSLVFNLTKIKMMSFNTNP